MKLLLVDDAVETGEYVRQGPAPSHGSHDLARLCARKAA